MEEKGIGSIIYYIVIIAVTLLSVLAGSRKRKQQQQPKPAMPADSFPDIPDRAEDFFPKTTVSETESIESDSAEMIPTENRNIDYTGYDETKASHSSIGKKKTIVQEVVNEATPPAEEFDAVKAVIYSEIMNRKF